MTIKWVQQDPLVMNGEPFCYGSRLTVRQLLELRANGYDLARILTDHPELADRGRRCGVHVREHPSRALCGVLRARRLAQAGPGYSEAEAAGLPSSTGSPGIVIKAG